MATVVLFHHVCGVTSGVEALADAWRAAGHTVHTPDLFDGRTFPSIEEGMAYADSLGSQQLLDAGRAALTDVPDDVVVAGVSLGVLVAQQLAISEPGVCGAILLEACVSPEWLDGDWPGHVPVQVHGMADDQFFAGDGDLDAAHALVAAIAHWSDEHDPTDPSRPRPASSVHVHPGDRHLFTDASLPQHDAAATAAVIRSTTAFLDAL